MKIEIKNIKTEAIIGVYEHEKTNKQPLFIDIQISYDSGKAAQTDNIEYALDYFELTNSIINFVENSSFNLLETLAEKLLDLILLDQRIKKSSITIRKPNALENLADYSSVIAKRKQ